MCRLPTRTRTPARNQLPPPGKATQDYPTWGGAERCLPFSIGLAQHNGVTMLSTILIIVLILLLVGAIPGAWGHSKDWGKGPAGLVFIVLLIIIILVLTGRM
jgi:hypothetical protein